MSSSGFVLPGVTVERQRGDDQVESGELRLLDGIDDLDGLADPRLVRVQYVRERHHLDVRALVRTEPSRVLGFDILENCVVGGDERSEVPLAPCLLTAPLVHGLAQLESGAELLTQPSC
jgi:hypothetical protein